MPTCVCTEGSSPRSVRPSDLWAVETCVASIAANGKVVRPKDELPSLPASSLQLVSDKGQWGVSLTSKRAAAGLMNPDFLCWSMPRTQVSVWPSRSSQTGGRQTFPSPVLSGLRQRGNSRLRALEQRQRLPGELGLMQEGTFVLGFEE